MILLIIFILIFVTIFFLVGGFLGYLLISGFTKTSNLRKIKGSLYDLKKTPDLLLVDDKNITYIHHVNGYIGTDFFLNTKNSLKYFNTQAWKYIMIIMAKVLYHSL